MFLYFIYFENLFKSRKMIKSYEEVEFLIFVTLVKKNKNKNRSHLW